MAQRQPSQQGLCAYMWNNLGMAYEHLERLAESRDAYQAAADLQAGRAVESLARLKGVKTVRVARIDDSEPH